LNCPHFSTSWIGKFLSLCPFFTVGLQGIEKNLINALPAASFFSSNFKTLETASSDIGNPSIAALTMVHSHCAGGNTILNCLEIQVLSKLAL